MISVFGSLYHFQMRLQPDKNQKNRREKFSVFTAGSIFRSISRVMGVINDIRSSVVCIIYRCAYSQIKIRKIGKKKFSVFTAGSIFRSISRVMGVINEFGLR